MEEKTEKKSLKKGSSMDRPSVPVEDASSVQKTIHFTIGEIE